MAKTASIQAYWSRTPDELLQTLGSSADGLSTEQAQERLGQYGPNTLRARRRVTPWGVFLNQLKSPIMIILLVATVISAATQDRTNAIIIAAIVLASATLSATQEYRANNAIEELRARTHITCDVLRDGQLQHIPAEQVVPGDVVQLSAGSLVPADGVILDARDLFVSQAVLTGETFPVEKKPGALPEDASLPERTNAVFMGTDVRTGTGRVLIVQTGTSTAFGQIARHLEARAPETEFERGVRRFGYLLSEIMLILVLFVFAVNVLLQKPVLDSLLFSVALAVGLTPQLLPAIISVNLSRGAQRMATEGVIVRRLASIENFGSMDVLCTDKTGTLTEGIVHLNAALNAQGQPSDEVMRAAIINAHFQSGLTNPLDQAILADREVDLPGVTKIDEIPYDFHRKRLSVVVQEGNQHWLITKGALDRVLEICTQIRLDSGSVPLDDAQQAQIQQRMAEWSAQGFRVLGVATRQSPTDQHSYTLQDEHDLDFIGFLLFLDPPKADAKAAIDDLASLGVQIKVITGDNRLVANHVAQMLDLPVDNILTGKELEGLSDEELWPRAEQASLFVEVDPAQKERIIMAIRKGDHVVGFMGDGVNDAPALHAADVSISVDSAVDVAKEAADFVLLQKDLGVLHRGIIEGRRTFANTLKYVFMASSANFGNMFSVAGASLFLPFLPLLPKQILLVNLLTDLPEMAIAGDNVDKEFVDRPHRWDIGFIRRFMGTFGPLSSIFDYMTFGLLLFVRSDQELFHTGWFVESIVSAALVVLSLRTRYPMRRGNPSRTLLISTFAVIAVAAALPYTPLAPPLGLKPLPPTLLLALGGIVLIYLLSAELGKRWFYRHFVARGEQR